MICFVSNDSEINTCVCYVFLLAYEHYGKDDCLDMISPIYFGHKTSNLNKINMVMIKCSQGEKVFIVFLTNSAETLSLKN